MSLDKLSKQLRRDLAANPKKAAALGLMVLVALYFWGPLVWKFVAAGGPKRDKTANMSSLILTDDPAEPGQQNQARRGPKFKWEKVRQLISKDSLMTSASFDVAWIDPFAKPATPGGTEINVDSPADDPAATAAAAAAAVAAIDPNNLGVVLNGVMVSPRGRLATINGDSYREGDVFSLTDKQDKSATFQFRLAKINRNSVQIESHGRIFTLELMAPKLAHGDDIELGKPKAQ